MLSSSLSQLKFSKKSSKMQDKMNVPNNLSCDLYRDNSRLANTPQYPFIRSNCFLDFILRAFPCLRLFLADIFTICLHVAMVIFSPSRCRALSNVSFNAGQMLKIPGKKRYKSQRNITSTLTNHMPDPTRIVTRPTLPESTNFCGFQ